MLLFVRRFFFLLEGLEEEGVCYFLLEGFSFY